MRSDLVEITGRIVHTTDRALLLDDGARQGWVPLAHVEIETKGGGVVVVSMPEWLAIERKFV